ncbi:MAG: hypothetical protein A2145_01080 [candidate division Zixibacteria bacterium RBG_16_40_9]|nr:MAG: hypothetical protein A2145_01080 [candidate division Zixibacteria bacterium RBG_16_40_9]
MKNKIFLVVGMLLIVLVLIYVVSLTNTNQSSTEGVKSKEAPKAYINKEKPTAIYIEGKSEPVLRIEDLPKEFPPHIKHPEGARFPDTKFIMAELSSGGRKIAFSGGYHEWVGVYELSSKKIHVIDWFFDTHIDQILWSPNSQFFAFTYGSPSDERRVDIIGFMEKTNEPYNTNFWSSGVGNPVLISNLKWSMADTSLQFDTRKFEMKNEPAMTITLKAIKETEEEVKEPPKKVKRTN